MCERSSLKPHRRRQPTWTRTHILATVGGAILTYAWLGAVMEPESGPKTLIDHLGTAAIIAFSGLLWLKAWRLRHAPRKSMPSPEQTSG